MKTLMVILLLKLNFSKMEKKEKKKDDLLTCVALPQVKMVSPRSDKNILCMHVWILISNIAGSDPARKSVSLIPGAHARSP